MILLDSSFLVAYKIENDQHHEQAKNIMLELVKGKYGQIFTSDYIFDETITVVLVRSKNLSAAVEIGERIMQSTKVLEVEEDIFKTSWKTFKNQKGTKFSFTDCTIIELMKKNGISNIATFDEDFTKVKEINVING